LDRREMLKRLYGKGEDPLELSIRKWEDIYDAIKRCRKYIPETIGKLEDGIHNCALCEIAFDSGCGSCPVAQSTKSRSCIGTPYWAFTNALRKSDLYGLKRAARAEIEFLKSLRFLWKEIREGVWK